MGRKCLFQQMRRRQRALVVPEGTHHLHPHGKVRGRIPQARHIHGRKTDSVMSLL